MGELTVLTCSLASVVLIAMDLVVAILCSLDSPDSSDVARLRAALAPNRKA